MPFVEGDGSPRSWYDYRRLPKNLDRLNQLRASVNEAAPGDAKAALESALAEQLIAVGDYAEALVHLGSARRAAEHQSLREHIDLYMGIALLRRGEAERSEPHLERYLEGAKVRSDAAGGARARVYLGEIYRRRNEKERAIIALDSACLQLEAHPDGGLLSHAVAEQAAIALAEGNAARASELATRAIELADAAEVPAERSSALLILSEARRKLDDLNGAEDACRQAIAAVAGARMYAFKVVETPGRFKETDHGMWTAQEIADSWDAIVKT